RIRRPTSNATKACLVLGGLRRRFDPALCDAPSGSGSLGTDCVDLDSGAKQKVSALLDRSGRGGVRGRVRGSGLLRLPGHRPPAGAALSGRPRDLRNTSVVLVAAGGDREPFRQSTAKRQLSQSARV